MERKYTISLGGILIVGSGEVEDGSPKTEVRSFLLPCALRMRETSDFGLPSSNLMN